MQANLGFLKVLVAKSKDEGLQLHLRSMVEGLLMRKDNFKTHFKAKVCFLFSMLLQHDVWCVLLHSWFKFGIF